MIKYNNIESKQAKTNANTLFETAKVLKNQLFKKFKNDEML